MAHRPALGLQLVLEVGGAVDAGLDAGEARGVVDLDDAAQTAQVHGEHLALLVALRG